MILVMLGTQNVSFHRLLQEIDKCIEDGTIKEEVIVQAGKTKYDSKNMQIFDFVSEDALNEYVEKSNFVITHGGVNSMLNCIKIGKKAIVVPRLKKYKEALSNHQLQIIEGYTEKGYILGIKDVSELKEAINKIEKFVPNKYENLTGNITGIISDYINKN